MHRLLKVEHFKSYRYWSLKNIKYYKTSQDSTPPSFGFG